jgi:hypothetical protein
MEDYSEGGRLAAAPQERRAVVPAQAGFDDGFAADPEGGPEPGPAHAGSAYPAAAPAARSLPLWSRVLLGDLALAVVGLVVFVIVGLQRINDATLDQRRHAWVEDIILFFVFGAVYLLVAYLLRRAGQTRVALAQLAVAVIVLGLGGVAAATGSPTDDSVISPIPASELPSTMNP